MNIFNKIIPENSGPRPYFKKKKIEKIDSINDEECFLNLGDKNKDKTFYIIRRSPGAGIFSNLIVILNHLKICKNKNYIPFIDMENFITIYNEEKPIENNYNAWEYYFENLSNFTLDEIYQSKNVIISPNKIKNNMVHFPHKYLEFRDLFKENIHFNKPTKEILNNKLVEYNLDKFKTLGIHFRGTSYKRSPRHPLPATIDQIINFADYLINKYSFEKIFLVTEEKRYLEKLQKIYGNKIFFVDSYRSNEDDAFIKYNRNLHRYKLGLESIIEGHLLSKCSGILYVSSNLVHTANLISDNNQKLFEIYNGWNSKNRFYANYKWFIKKLLPTNFFGLKNRLISH